MKNGRTHNLNGGLAVHTQVHRPKRRVGGTCTNKGAAMNQTNLLRTGLMTFGLAAAAALALAGTTATAESNTSRNTYSWSAELVAFEPQAGTMTVQARLVTEADAAALRSLDTGDRATLVWSGLNWAAGVRKVTQDAPAEGDHLTLPIEFVSTEVDDRYVRFKVPVPSVDRARIEALSEGSWVTATSPRRATSYEEGVATVRPYNDVG